MRDAIGIKPPSFDKAFGSKAGFFGRILERCTHSTLALDELLLPGRAPAEALAVLLRCAAHAYAADPELRGCLMLETIRGGEQDSTVLARRFAARRRDQICLFIAATHPAASDAVTDFIAGTMSGLSAPAREGIAEPRLRAVAHAAVAGVHEIPGSSGRA